MVYLMQAISSKATRRSDKLDTEKIARYARLDPKIVRPIAHRTVMQQETLTLIRARDVLAGVLEAFPVLHIEMTLKCR